MPTATDANLVVLCLNVGSSSLKAAVRDPALRLRLDVAGLDRGAGHVTVEVPGSPSEDAGPCGWDDVLTTVAAALTRHGLRPDVVAHRIVHGSPLLPGAVPAGGALLARLRIEADVDPLHLPRQLDVVDQACRQWPQAQVVLVPDSGFHDRLPDEAVALPLPAEARSAGLRRWGFHGLAVQSVVDLVPGLGRAVVVHLGSGCSVTAVDSGVPRHTTMALSPAGGVPSLTRSGDLDPEVVLLLVEREGSIGAVRELLNRRSGVAGLSGGRTDLRNLLQAEDAAADLAVRVFVRDVAMAVAAAVTTLDGWDSLVFTGGIGVHSAEVRERVCARLLPLRPDAARLPGSPSERLVSTGLRVLAVPVDEEAVMDRLARAVPSRGDESPTGGRDGGSGGRPRVVVAVASRHGGTWGVAEAVADGIRRIGGADVAVRDAAQVASVRDCDAVVVGSAVYHGHWLPEARDLVLRTAIDLWDRPVWAFSSGPVGTPARPPEELLDVEEMLTLTRCREHRVFPGRLDRSLLGLAERAVVTALHAPEGDFRDLPAATAWGSAIGAALTAASPPA